MNNDEDMRQVSRLHRVNRTIKEMIRDRVRALAQPHEPKKAQDAQGEAEPAFGARSASLCGLREQKYGVSTEEIEIDFEDFRADLTKSGGVE